MEVHFTPEQIERLSQIATHAGTNPEQVVKDAALRLIKEEEQFRAADHGEFVEHDEVWANVEKILRS